MRKSSPLRNLRRSRTLSQQELARLLRISQQTLSKYETGALLPPTDMRVRIAAILGVAVADVFRDETLAANRGEAVA